MAWIYNKATKVITECHNKDIIKICKKDVEGYQVSDTKESISISNPDSLTAEKKNPKKMSASELREYAEQQGIEVTEGLTMREILSILGE